MKDINELLRQAREMQERLREKERSLANLSVEGESGAGLVKVTLNGKFEARSVRLDGALMKEDREVVEDLIAAAFNDAVRRLREKGRETLGAMAGAIDLPEGVKFPF